ncbi:hypothetical protein AtEden1_Chr2g0233401 [Arabidopsis thaliana]
MSKLIGMLLNDKQVYVGPFLRGKKGILLAVESLKGNTFDDKQWVVDRGQKKSEREMELKVPYEQSLKEIADKFQSYNLGSGFVAFSTQNVTISGICKDVIDESVAMPPSVGPRMPIYPLGSPGIRKSMFYG